jgi:hypothetical protein
MTFTDLRRALTAPTSEQIAAALEAELLALAAEFGNCDGFYWTQRDSAAQVALHVAASLAKHNANGPLLALVVKLVEAENLAAKGINLDDFEDAVGDLEEFAAQKRGDLAIYQEQFGEAA